MPNSLEQFEAKYGKRGDGSLSYAGWDFRWEAWQAGAAAERQKKPNLTMTITPAMGATITAESGCTVYPGDVFQLFKVGDRSAP